MCNNDYMYAVERNGEYLAHYGVRGMKWGVRKAIQSGNSARLSRQYAKAQKKLAKLEKQAGKTKKYARRAALMGAGAAAAGGLAAAGTSGVAKAVSKLGGAAGVAQNAVAKGIGNVGNVLNNYGRIHRNPKLRKIGASMEIAGQNVKAGTGATVRGFNTARRAIGTWGNSNSIGKAAGKKFMDATSGNVALNNLSTRLTGANSVGVRRALEKTSNNTIARIGAGAIGAGLAAGAARNAYKAATAKKKAARFKSEMNKAFAGTKYANGGQKPRQGNKKRRK